MKIEKVTFVRTFEFRGEYVTMEFSVSEQRLLHMAMKARANKERQSTAGPITGRIVGSEAKRTP